MHPLVLMRYCIETEIPILVMGAPGTGKTSTSYALCAAMDAHLEVVLASLRDPTDFGGLPNKTDDGSVALAPPNWAKRIAISPKRKRVVIFDEATTAPHAVQAAMLRVLFEGVVGDLDIRPAAFILLANPVELASGGYDLTPAFSNRVLHAEWKLDTDNWVSGMTGGFALPDLGNDCSTWRDHVMAQRALVAAYIHHRPGQLLVVPKEEGDRSKAWPSPRTWTLATNVAAAHVASGSTEPVASIYEAAVGTAAAMEFAAWLSAQDLPDPEALLADPSSWTKPARSDIAFAALASLAAATMARYSPERWAAAWEVLFIASSRDKMTDVAATAARALVHNMPTGATIPQAAFGVFGPMLKAAGKMRS